MSKIDRYEPGRFCWAELSTPDGEGAKRFYSELLGWKVNDVPMGPGSVYTMFQVQGLNAAAAYQQDPTMKAQGVPPHWLCYVSVPNVDEVVAKARGLNAKILREPMDVFDSGRMAVVQDPTGAVFGLWQPNKHIGAEWIDDEGGLCWTELMTRDTLTASRFYSQLFGWRPESHDMGGSAYTTFEDGAKHRSGMMAISQEMGPVPPHWLAYFTVADTDATANRAASMGGKVLVPPTDIPTVGRFSIVQDPFGAAFAVIKVLPKQEQK